MTHSVFQRRNHALTGPRCACGKQGPVLHYRLEPRNLREIRVLCCKACGEKNGLAQVSFDRPFMESSFRTILRSAA